MSRTVHTIRGDYELVRYTSDGSYDLQETGGIAVSFSFSREEAVALAQAILREEVRPKDSNNLQTHELLSGMRVRLLHETVTGTNGELYDSSEGTIFITDRDGSRSIDFEPVHQSQHGWSVETAGRRNPNILRIQLLP